MMKECRIWPRSAFYLWGFSIGYEVIITYYFQYQKKQYFHVDFLVLCNNDFCLLRAPNFYAGLSLDDGASLITSFSTFDFLAVASVIAVIINNASWTFVYSE